MSLIVYVDRYRTVSFQICNRFHPSRHGSLRFSPFTQPILPAVLKDQFAFLKVREQGPRFTLTHGQQLSMRFSKIKRKGKERKTCPKRLLVRKTCPKRLLVRKTWSTQVNTGNVLAGFCTIPFHTSTMFRVIPTMCTQCAHNVHTMCTQCAHNLHRRSHRLSH